ncbi:MAG: hypothetical protein AAGK10_06605, partial [Cyanobacteria bacterium J06555_3]
IIFFSFDKYQASAEKSLKLLHTSKTNSKQWYKQVCITYDAASFNGSSPKSKFGASATILKPSCRFEKSTTIDKLLIDNKMMIVKRLKHPAIKLIVKRN